MAGEREAVEAELGYLVGGGVADASGPGAGIVVFGVPGGEFGEWVVESGLENDEAQNVVVEGGVRTSD